MMRYTFHCLCVMALLAAPKIGVTAEGDDQARAMEQLERTAFENPDNPTLQGELADAYFRIYRESQDPVYEELSIAQYKKFLSLQPEHDGAKLALYTLQYGKLLKSPNPGLLQSLKKLFDGMSESGRAGIMPPSTMEAISLLVASEKDPSVKVEREQIQALLKNGVRESPRFSTTYFMLARNYRHLRDSDSEIAVLRQAAFMLPDNAEVMKKLAQALDNKISGTGCYATEHYLLEDTIQAWQKVLPYLPEDAEAHRELLLKYELKGLYDLQLFEARTLYKLTNSASDRLLLADSLVSAGYLREALETYKAVQKKSSALSSLKQNMATAYFYDQNLDAAAKMMTAYMREEPDEFYARAFNTVIENARGNGDNARSLLRKFMLERKDDYDEWMRQLANYLLGHVTAGQLIEAAQNPCQQTEAYYYIGMDHTHRKDVAAAKDYFNKVLSLKVYGFREYVGASYALKNLEAAGP